MVASSGRLLRRVRATPAVVVALVVSLVAAVVVLGEPSRPATATVVRPVVTVAALCSAPTVVDVAARDATRGLTAIGQLLGLPDELVGEAARDVRIVDTDAGAFFVLVRDAELRVAALSPAGLPIVNAEVTPPQTYRAFALGDLDGRPSSVVGGPEGVFVVFGGAGAPAEVFALTPATLASSFEVSVARDPDGPELADPLARAGSAVVHEGVLWLAGDDGRVVTFDPLAEAGERWEERAEGLVVPLLAQGEVRVHGVFASDADEATVEVRSFPAEGDPQVTPITTPVRAVTGVSYPESTRPAFAVTTEDGAGLLRPDDARTSVVDIPAVEGRLLGLVATDQAAALLTSRGGNLGYEVFDAAGTPVGSFGTEGEGRCVVGSWRDAAAVIEPGSAGSLLHLHDPSSAWDCVVDTREPSALAELTERCAPDGEWSVDKGSAPARDFTVEIGRALDELAADDLERDADTQADDPATSAAEAIQEELSEAGLGVIETEVDPEAADECAAEEVESVAPPVLDLAEPVGARAVRVEWSWSGGSCLPGRYVVTMCRLAGQGSECVDPEEREVAANPTSARSSLELPARPDRTYRVTVRAGKGAVLSAPSGALLVTTPAVTPDPPTGVSGALTAGTWQLSWSSCLAGGDCDQRPDGFLVTVEGCDGDGLGQARRRFDVSQRGTSFGADGAGFGDVDLLGRRVQFRVATTFNERVSEPVNAGGCTRSVRPGRDAPASDVGVSLTGRSRQITLAALTGGRQLSELFGTTEYDSVRARLLRGGSSFSADGNVLAGSVTFQVDRCSGSGWTVELTPRRGGNDLTAHRSRLTDAVVTCNPSVDSNTSISTSYVGSNASGVDVRVTIPGLGQDDLNELVAGVTGTATCDRAFSSSESHTLSGGAISGDQVSFRIPTVPAILDLQAGCVIRPVVAFRGGGSAAPAGRSVDLGPAGPHVAPKVAEIVASRLASARTGRYQRFTGIAGLGSEDVVTALHGGSGVPCSGTYGGSRWSFELRGTPHATCGDGSPRISFGKRHLDDRQRGEFRVRVELDGVLGLGAVAASVDQRIAVCELDGLPSEPQLPCAPECRFDPTLPAGHPDCPAPCPYDGDVAEGDPRCPEPCPDDPSIPVGDPACRPGPPSPPGGPPAEPPGQRSTVAAPTTLATILSVWSRSLRRG